MKRGPKLVKPAKDTKADKAQTEVQVFAEIDAMRERHGAGALPAIRKYLTRFKEREIRQKEIARLRAELAEMERKG